jgi:gamma-glutamyl hydrolase
MHVFRGTCLGIETQAVIANNYDESVLGYFDAENISLPVYFPETSKTSSRMLKYIRRLISHELQPENFLSSHAVADNLHTRGISIETFYSNVLLNSAFRILGISKDRNGKEFVALWEGLELPMYASQFHPERNLFEWSNDEALVHGTEVSVVMQSFAVRHIISFNRFMSIECLLYTKLLKCFESQFPFLVSILFVIVIWMFANIDFAEFFCP